MSDSGAGQAADSSASPTSARLHNVSKLFGSFAALRQVSIELEQGRCYVLLGENGAGKSTLLRILAGLLEPSFGTAKVFNGLDPHEARARIGYMSHAPMLYDELTAQEDLARVRPDLDGNQIMQLLDIPAGPQVGEAWRFLKELRLDRGPLTNEEATDELLAWWRSQGNP